MTTSLVTAPPRVEDQDLLDRLIAEQGRRPGALLSILEKAQDQNRHKYLPMETLEYVAARTGVPQAQVYGVATFYALFNLEPQGANTVSICRGTACHTRGSRALLERLKLQLNLQQPEDGGADKLTLTTPDRRFTIRTVACFGQCALAPVVEVNHAIRGHVKEQALMREVDKLRKESGR
ncbi:MAG TPA: NAD(P)H-dependent oxidoreductase subunit E [Vicinamibacteria bacterium]|nr:NAD(P)H-dependent oxidoreductase subunit E [Vicinamibacteria bacterium]